ncbi:MAG: hypothetical protein Q9N68_09755 [Gammaproteobacteria bacterium]|nr:hypothetical protein [Gammaproteobacteria bacterium]
MKFASKLAVTTAALMTGLSGLMISGEAGAVPAFARQTGMACNTCHFQSFPILTAFGRSFKADGYLMAGSQGLIEGQDLSLPNTLNIAMVGKVLAEWHKPDGASGYANDTLWPDELGMLIGGRLSENAGFLFELDQAGGSGMAGGKVQFNVADFGASKLSIITFNGDAPYGMELLNTGALSLQRPIEGHDWSAAELLGTFAADSGSAADGVGGGVATAAVVHSSSFMVNATAYSFDSAVESSAIYLRGVWMGDVSGWDVGVGVQNYSGTSTVGAVAVDANKTVFDAQAQGMVSDMPLGVYASFGTAPGSDAAATVKNAYNATADDATAMGILAQLYVMPNVAVYGGYGNLDSGDAVNTANSFITVGAKFKPAQNITLEAFSITQTTTADGAADATDSKLGLLLFAGF